MEDAAGPDTEVQTVSSSVSSPVPRTPDAELKKLLSFKVYKRRWFVLLVLCLLNCSNATLWLTFAPVADQSAKFLGASLEQINWLSLVYMVVAIPLSFGTTWMLDTLGLRTTLILGAWLNMAGALLRFLGAFVQKGPAFPLKYLLVMCGQTLGALAQPLIIFAPTKMAALWFPEHQRAIANTMASMSNPLGILVASLSSPLIAETPERIPYLLLVYAVPACIICVLATVGMRSSSPPTPPSASADSSSSEPFFKGIKLLLTNRAYLVLLLCFGSGIAVFTCFSTLLEQILCVQGYTNTFAGVCGALFIVSGIVGAILLGVYVDKTKRFIEATKINMSLSALSCIAFSVVALMQQQKVAVAVVCSLFGFFGFSIYPVAMELSVECSYPVGEATSAGLVFVSGQIQSVLYIVLLQALTKRLADSPLSTCGDAVLSWKVPMMVMAGLCAFFTCCFVIFFHTRYRRLEAEERAVYGTGRRETPTTSESAPSVKTFAGVCGALFIVSGIVGAILLGVYVDKTKRFIEATKINMSLSALSCIAFSVVALMQQQKVAVAVVCSLFGFFGFSIYPVAMELSVECSYPVGEATSAGLVFVSGQIQSVLYIVLLQALTKRLADSPLSTCGDAVLSWKVPMMVMAGLCAFFTCCFVIFFHTRYRRLEAEERAVYGTGRRETPTTSESAPSVKA